MNAELCFDGLFEKLKTCMEKRLNLFYPNIFY